MKNLSKIFAALFFSLFLASGLDAQVREEAAPGLNIDLGNNDVPLCEAPEADIMYARLAENVFAFAPTGLADGHTVRWDFGDGTGSDEASPIKEFNRPGSYMVTLAIRNQCGESGRTSVLLFIEGGDTAQDDSHR